MDDEPVIVDLIQTMLKGLGYRGEARHSPLEALDLFKSRGTPSTW